MIYDLYSSNPKLDINLYLEKIESNNFDFGYRDITQRIYEIVYKLIETENLKISAEISFETGAYPPMQVAAGIGGRDVLRPEDLR